MYKTVHQTLSKTCWIRACVCCQMFQFSLGGINSVKQPNSVQRKKNIKSQKDKMSKWPLYLPMVPFKALWAAYYQFNSASLSFLFLSVTIDSLYKVTEGGQSDVFHRHGDSSFDPACCFTVYHGNHMESLDLVASNAEEARTWVTGLRYLMAGISDEDSLAKRQRTHDQYPLTPAGLSVPLWLYGKLKSEPK